MFVQESVAEDIKLFYYCCVRTLWKAHTQTAKNLKHLPPPPWWEILFGTGEGKCQIRIRQIISADRFPNPWTDLTCPGFPGQKSHSRLARNFSWHCSPAFLTPTTTSATLCRNPSLQSDEELGQGPAGRLHSLPNNRQESTDPLFPQGPFPSQQPSRFLHNPEKGRHFNSSSSCFARWAARGDSMSLHSHLVCAWNLKRAARWQAHSLWLLFDN